MSKVRTSFGTIGVATDATDAGVPILFLHGVGSTKEVWGPQLDHFRDRRTAIAIDYPGYGESELRPGAARDDFARAALAVLDALGHERAHICGLSLGGVVAIAMHHAAPERCASLILADTLPCTPMASDLRPRRSASESMGELAAARTPMLLALCYGRVHQ